MEIACHFVVQVGKERLTMTFQMEFANTLCIARSFPNADKPHPVLSGSSRAFGYNSSAIMDIQSTSRIKGLVITDELESGKIWGYSLEQIGIQVTLVKVTEDIPGLWKDILPDLVLLEDFNLENEELEICRQLRQVSPVPILLLTRKTDEIFQLEAYRAGVDECILQPISPLLFLAKVQAWTRQTRNLPYATVEDLEAGRFMLQPERRQLSLPDGGKVQLTNLEVRLLYVLMHQPGKAVDSASLIERIWGSYGGGDNVMLKNLVYRLRRKIESDPTKPTCLLTDGNLGYHFSAM
jgi:DNA-binding response OmpR family regulator